MLPYASMGCSLLDAFEQVAGRPPVKDTIAVPWSVLMGLDDLQGALSAQTACSSRGLVQGHTLGQGPRLGPRLLTDFIAECEFEPRSSCTKFKLFCHYTVLGLTCLRSDL